jgi:hypothetical protein
LTPLMMLCDAGVAMNGTGGRARASSPCVDLRARIGFTRRERERVVRLA